MKLSIPNSLCWIAGFAYAVSVRAPALAQNAASYSNFSGPSYAVANSTVTFTGHVTNTGTTTWDSSYYVIITDSTGSHESFYSAAGLAPGQGENFTLNGTMPASGSDTFTAGMLQQNVQYFSMNGPSITVNPETNGATFSSVAGPTYATPNSTVQITGYVQNSGTTTWDSTYYVVLYDYAGNVTFYNVPGLAPGQGEWFSCNANIPNIEGNGTLQLNVKMEQAEVQYFADNGNSTTVTIDIPPSTSLGSSTNSPDDANPTTVTSTISAVYGNAINQAIDYVPPAGGNWVSGSESAGTRWDGSPTSQEVLAPALVLNPSGNWQFRSRGQDSVGQIGPFSFLNLTSGLAQQTGVAISASASSLSGQWVNVGDTVTLNASGGNGTGQYTWGGAANGTGPTTTLTFTTPTAPGQPNVVTCYRAGDGSYAASASTSFSFFVSAPVTISATNFNTFSPPTIQTTQPLASTYKLRAKFYNNSVNMQAQDQGNLNPAVLDIMPPAGSYTLALYWVQYDSSGTNILQVGPMQFLSSVVTQGADGTTPQSNISIQPSGTLYVTVGQTVAFSASGGSGTGDYVWGGAASGGGAMTYVTFGANSPTSVTVYKVGDATYAQSNTASVTISIGTAGQDNNNSTQLNLLFPTQLP